MIEEGIILKFTVVISGKKVGYPAAVLEIEVNPERSSRGRSSRGTF